MHTRHLRTFSGALNCFFEKPAADLTTLQELQVLPGGEATSGFSMLNLETLDVQMIDIQKERMVPAVCRAGRNLRAGHVFPAALIMRQRCAGQQARGVWDAREQPSMWQVQI